MTYEYEITSETNEQRASNIIRRELGLDVNVKIDAETGKVHILSEDELTKEQLEEITVVLKHWGFV